MMTMLMSFIDCFPGIDSIFKGLCLVLRGITWFYWVLLGFTEFELVLLGFTGFYLGLLGLT